jgi:RNA polymerase sigma-70 factor (ECF subfamily)
MRPNSLANSTDPATSRFHTFVWPHTDTVFRTARLIARNDADAEDLTQETMLKAYRRIGCLRDEARARPWLLKILRNTHIDKTRVHHRHELSLDNLDLDPADIRNSTLQLIEHKQSPDAAIEKFGDHEMIAELRRLPPNIRQTLLLVVVDGMTDAEAAEALAIPVGTVKSRLHRARNLLRKSLYSRARELHLAC